jgi:hypothetical protein
MDCVGTLKLNQEKVPKEVKDSKPKNGKIKARHSSPVSVTEWNDKNRHYNFHISQS